MESKVRAIYLSTVLSLLTSKPTSKAICTMTIFFIVHSCIGWQNKRAGRLSPALGYRKDFIQLMILAIVATIKLATVSQYKSLFLAFLFFPIALTSFLINAFRLQGYFIISCTICQYLFSIFFKIFFSLFASCQACFFYSLFKEKQVKKNKRLHM